MSRTTKLAGVLLLGTGLVFGFLIARTGVEPESSAEAALIKPILKHRRSHDVATDRKTSIFILISRYTTRRVKNRANNWTARLAAWSMMP